MKELIVTAEMQKKQDWARQCKGSDLDAVEIGWKIGAGRYITLMAGGHPATVEIVSEDSYHVYTTITNCPGKGIDNKCTQTTLAGIARLVLTDGAQVYYSK